MADQERAPDRARSGRIGPQCSCRPAGADWGEVESECPAAAWPGRLPAPPARPGGWAVTNIKPCLAITTWPPAPLHESRPCVSTLPESTAPPPPADRRLGLHLAGRGSSGQSRQRAICPLVCQPRLAPRRLRVAAPTARSRTHPALLQIRWASISGTTATSIIP